MGAGNCLFLTGKMRFDVLGFIPGGGGGDCRKWE